MNFLTDPLVKTAEEAQALAKRVAEGGMTVFRSSLRQVPLLNAVQVETGDAEGAERDETHYFLVPFHQADAGYVVYTARRLPDGHSAENDLPKLRVFHVPGAGSERVLEQLLVDGQVAEAQNEAGSDVLALHDRLNRLGDEIDKTNNLVSGGLFVVGGVVAVANPLLGVGIIAKALVPSLGAKLSSEGLRHLGDKLRGLSDSAEEKSLRKAAEKELRAIEVEVFVNPLLQALEKALQTTVAEFDPLVDFDEGTFLEAEDQGRGRLLMTARAVNAVYREVLDGGRADKAAASLGAEDERWLQTLRAFEARAEI